jgi:NAD(P)-dependent dehydrogenase (short-subunit alcohol dehydrogenase family)
MTDPSTATGHPSSRAVAPPFLLGGKVAAVTGAASGIGQSVALLLARQGARVFVLDVDAAGAADTVARITGTSGEASPVVCDVASAAAVARAFGEIESLAGRLDILVNNAGIAHIGNLESTTEDDFDRVYAVNVKGVFFCLRAAAPLMVRSGGGAIVNVSSIAALVGLESRFAYSATKGAVQAMTLSVARDYLTRNIRCNAVCPARVHTPFVDGFLSRNYPGREREMFARLAAAQPIGRMGTPDEVAALVLYLCSDEAAFITGCTYPIDGGVLTAR